MRKNTKRIITKKAKPGKLVFKDGTNFEGLSFGAEKSIAGEVVFTTGMVGYPEALTDPSFRGQILVMTFPLIGNYGVPKEEFLEREAIQVAGLVVCNYVDTPSHYASKMTLGEWFKKEGVPLLEIKDTRKLVQKLRDEGSALGKISIGSEKVNFEDPNERNLVAEVSVKEIVFYAPTPKGKNKGVGVPTASVGREEDKQGVRTVVLLDCGAKRNIIRSLVKRGLRVAVAPWDTDLTTLDFPFKALVISNGPGDPKMADQAIKNVKKILNKKIPILGICLGNQILTLAAGGNTYKMKFGNRSQNQPAVERGTDRCYLTTQNHGFAVGKIPKGFREWFYNANDNTNEGIIHEKLPIMSVQFHPESSPGPLDTDWIFDYFLKRAKIYDQKNKF